MKSGENKDLGGLLPVPKLPEELRAQMVQRLQTAENLRVVLGRPVKQDMNS